MRRYVLRRLLIFIPQVIGVTFLVFLLIRLLPGDPARQLAGALASPEAIASIRTELRLDEPLLEQYWVYISRAATGDLGVSITTSQPVADDIAQRLPATLELLLFSVVIGLALAIPFGVLSAVRRRGLLRKSAFLYGMLAGAIPDFFLGLLLIYFFFTQLGWAPAPVGQLDFGIPPPTDITGMYVVDAALTGNWTAFSSAAAHAILPVATLVFVYFALVLKLTRATMEEILDSRWMRTAIAAGISRRRILRYGIRNTFPPVLTVLGLTFLFLLGGAVLVETIFSWGGLGQYAVQAITASDYQAVQGFVLIAALFSLIVNLVIDVLYSFVDPRIRYAQ